MSGEMEYYFLKIRKIQFVLKYMNCKQIGLKEFLQIVIKLILLEENH